MFVNWERKYEQFAMDFAKSASERYQQEWSKHYSQICIFTVTTALSCIVTHLIEFKVKTKEFQPKNFRKAIQAVDYPMFESILKYSIMDYMILLIEQKEVRDFLLTHNISDDQFEDELFQCFGFTQPEKVIYYKLKTVSGTLEHSVHLIEMLGASTEAKNEGMLLGVEYFKKNFFDNLKKHLFKVF